MNLSKKSAIESNSELYITSLDVSEGLKSYIVIQFSSYKVHFL